MDLYVIEVTVENSTIYFSKNGGYTSNLEDAVKYKHQFEARSRLAILSKANALVQSTGRLKRLA